MQPRKSMEGGYIRGVLVTSTSNLIVIREGVTGSTRQTHDHRSQGLRCGDLVENLWLLSWLPLTAQHRYDTNSISKAYDAASR